MKKEYMKLLRYEYEDEVLHYLEKANHMIRGLCDRGLYGLNKIVDSGFITEENNSIIFLFRNSLAFIDAIAEAVRVPSVENIKVIARSYFELKCYIDYIFKDNTNNRSIAYQVYYIREKIKSYQKIDADTELGIEISKEWGKDRTFSTRERINYDTKEAIRNLEKQLNRSPYKEINEKYNSMKGNIGWFSFDIDKRSFLGLCEYLECRISYEFLYKQWSGMIHGTAAYQENILHSGKGGIEAIRSLNGFSSTISILVPIIIESYFTVFSSIVPDYYERILRYYKNILRSQLDEFNSINIESK